MDMVGGGPFRLDPGQWTDDTAMALALGESLLGKNAFDPHDCMKRFVAWYHEGEYSCTGECFDIGMATRQALVSYLRDDNPFAGSTNPGSAGNGSLMRLAPVPIWGLKFGAETISRVAIEQSRTTHAAPECLAACEGYALILARAISGLSKQALLDEVVNSPSAKVAAVLAGRWKNKTRYEISSSGYVVDSMEAALWCVDQSSSFREAILLAANLGDDADTVAAITGQLAGALWGASAIPPEWRQKLAWSDHIAVLARGLI